MMPSARARDHGFQFGPVPTGPHNAITDVPGVRVGHVTYITGNLRTGFTAIVPHSDNLFAEKVPAAVEIINGFGKSVGTVQVQEVGTVETPILLTNTLSVGTGFNALAKLAIKANPEIGRELATVNPVVAECNDGYLNDIQAMVLTEDDAIAAVHQATPGPVAEGAVGAGTGMTCFGFKGGIGTASRQLSFEGQTFTLGVLVLANFGRAGDLILPDGRRAAPSTSSAGSAGSATAKTGGDVEKGSVIIVVATNLPLTCRQLRRVAQRGGAGVARLGSYWGHGSGDIAMAFSTAHRVLHDESRDVVEFKCLSEPRIDKVFAATADATQEAVMNALCVAPSMTGRDGHFRPCLTDSLEDGQLHPLLRHE